MLWNLLHENGFAGMAQAMQILLNEAMKIERSNALWVRPYQRTRTMPTASSPKRSIHRH